MHIVRTLLSRELAQLEASGAANSINSYEADPIAQVRRIEPFYMVLVCMV